VNIEPKDLNYYKNLKLKPGGEFFKEISLHQLSNRNTKKLKLLIPAMYIHTEEGYSLLFTGNNTLNP
jgi:hypothetical protein